MTAARTTGPSVAAGVAIGVGMGGFLDGIVLHQILQVHNMLSARIPVTDLVSAKINMVWDGLFHAAVWLFTALGIVLLWRAGCRPGGVGDARSFVGALLLGFGLFNVVEGVVNHHLLGLHHVYEALGASVWDYVFLAWGGVMIILGLFLLGPGGKKVRV